MEFTQVVFIVTSWGANDDVRGQFQRSTIGAGDLHHRAGFWTLAFHASTDVWRIGDQEARPDASCWHHQGAVRVIVLEEGINAAETKHLLGADVDVGDVFGWRFFKLALHPNLTAILGDFAHRRIARWPERCGNLIPHQP